MNGRAPDKDQEGKGRRVSSRALRRLFSYLTIRRSLIVLVIVLLLIGVLAFLSISILLGDAVNILSSSGGTLSEVHDRAILITVAAIVSALALFLAFRLLAGVAQTALYRLRKDLFDHVQELSLNFFDKQPIGELVSRINNDTDAITSLFQGPLGIMSMGVIMFIIALIAMLLLNAVLTLVVMLLLALLIGMVIFLTRIAGPAFTLLQQRVADMNGLMEETISGQRTVIAYRQQGRATHALQAVSEGARNVGTRAQLVSLASAPLTTMITNLTLAVVALVGSLLILHVSLPIGTLVTFLSYTQLFVIPLFTIFANFNYLLLASAGATRIFQILDEKPKVVDVPNAPPMDLREGHVVFENVDFSYVPGRKILTGVSFEARPGQMIGLCGPTGGGKSTLINILTRYYDIDSGRILIDDQDIHGVQQHSLRSQIATVLQEPFLFSDTVMNNLKFAREGATDEECREAAREANCEEFIQRLPQGYDTVLVEGGSNISQGQRQLLTIARAMLARPKMLILDEATSNVDTRTEKSIQEAIRKLQEGRTSFVIAHRLSTIRNADQILVINEKRIFERGTHEELMAQRGFYYGLYMGQFKGRVADVLPSEKAPEVGAE